MLSRLWAKVLFDSVASHLFIAASCVRELGLEVEALKEPLYVSSPLGTRVSLNLISLGCELEISGILLTVDLRVMDMSEFDVILAMDWLTAYRVVIDWERRRVIAYTHDGTRVAFQGIWKCRRPEYATAHFKAFVATEKVCRNKVPWTPCHNRVFCVATG